MGLLDTTANSITGAGDFIKNSLSSDKPVPRPPDPDFKGGFRIVEIQNGRRLTAETVTLIGNLMPFQPFNFGGEQKVVKNYYPGNSEPTAQVLGPQEKDVVIKGRFKDKKYKTPEARGVAYELQQQIDAIRIRGNLVEITMGEWQRYGFLIDTDWNLKTKADIDYQLTFTIIGFNPPLRCQQVQGQKEVPFEINKELISRLAEFQAEINNVPETVPQSIGDIIREAVSDVSNVISSVTGFIDDVLGTVEDVTQAIDRAQGVVKFAQLEVLRFKNRVGAIGLTSNSFDVGNQGFNNTNRAYITGAVSSSFDLMAFLAELRDRLAQLIATSPLARVRVKSGDSLQAMASKFYNDPGEWERIYDHNGLTTTDLEIGVVLEIPRI